MDFLVSKCHLTEHTADDVMRAKGIFLTNGVNQGMVKGHGLYPTFSFLSHRLEILQAKPKK